MAAKHVAGSVHSLAHAASGWRTACRVLWLIIFITMLPAQASAAPPLGGAPMGKLAVTIEYYGDFYRETFGYTPDAPNIRHYALILPADVAALYGRDADGVFGGLQFPATAATPVQWRPGVDGALDWATPYLHLAPGGQYTATLKPGEYAVWTAFIAAPLSRAAAGVGEDAILWAGVTGGGASTRDPALATVAAGETTVLSVPLTDANGWACPWLYVYDGNEYVRTTEVLRTAVADPPAPYRELTRLGRVPVVDGAVRLRLAEEKDEVTTLDAFTIVANGLHLAPDEQPTLASADDVTLELARDEQVDLAFTLPATLAARPSVQVSVIAVGYYLPLSPATADPLPSWNDGAAKQAILQFVQAVTAEGGPQYVPPAEAHRHL